VSQDTFMGYWRHKADQRLGNPSQGNWEPTVVRDKDESSPGEQVCGMWYFFPSVLWYCWLGTERASGL